MSVIVKQHLVQMSQVDGPTEYLSQILNATGFTFEHIRSGYLEPPGLGRYPRISSFDLGVQGHLGHNKLPTP